MASVRQSFAARCGDSVAWELHLRTVAGHARALRVGILPMLPQAVTVGPVRQSFAAELEQVRLQVELMAIRVD